MSAAPVEACLRPGSLRRSWRCRELAPADDHLPASGAHRHPPVRERYAAGRRWARSPGGRHHRVPPGAGRSTSSTGGYRPTARLARQMTVGATSATSHGALPLRTLSAAVGSRRRRWVPAQPERYPAAHERYRVEMEHRSEGGRVATRHYRNPPAGSDAPGTPIRLKAAPSLFCRLEDQ